MNDSTQPADLRLDGRYRLHELLGRGGSGRVYRAVDERLGRDVAVKIFTHGARDDAERRRAVVETRVLANLSHPNLVTVHDAALEADPPYLVMELVDGDTLAGRIDARGADPAAAATVAIQIGRALADVHAAGVVHRDIKPSNILLRNTPDGVGMPVLADFGIAYSAETTRVTEPGVTIGTAAYLSPEQVRGLTPSPEGDIYSLGLVLIETLTGRRAFESLASPAAMIARLERSPELDDDVTPGWRALLSAMTALDPADRPGAATVAATADGLRNEGHESTAPTRAYPSAQTTRARSGATPTRQHASGRPARRTVLIGAGALAGVIALCAIGIGLWSGTADSSAAPDPTLPALEEPLDASMADLLTAVSP